MHFWGDSHNKAYIQDESKKDGRTDGRCSLIKVLIGICQIWAILCVSFLHLV